MWNHISITLLCVGLSNFQLQNQDMFDLIGLFVNQHSILSWVPYGLNDSYNMNLIPEHIIYIGKTYITFKANKLKYLKNKYFKWLSYCFY